MNLSFAQLRKQNVERCNKSFRPLDEWSPTDWATALAGECGELCNEIKKMRRIAETPEMLHAAKPEGLAQQDYQMRLQNVADELADVITYCDLLAARLGINLATAVCEKFNEVSGRVGSRLILPAGELPEPPEKQAFRPRAD